MPIRATVDHSKFNPAARLPYELRLADFEIAMQDIYDFFFDVNSYLNGKGLQRLDDMLRKQTMSGRLSDMLTASVAKHSIHHYPLAPTLARRRGFRERAAVSVK